MATTSPDNIRTPNPSDPYNLVADLAITASDVQTALDRRANLYTGTAAQRTAFTTALEGVHWQDTDDSKTEWVRQAGVWRGVTPVRGVTTLTFPVSAPGGTVNISFPPGRFSSPPVVMATKQSAAAAKYTVYVTNITASGATLGVYSGDGTSLGVTVPIGWVAYDA